MFDGPDGVGKTEQIAMAQAALVKLGYDVYVTRSHGGTPIGESLRAVSLSDMPRTAETDLYLSRAIQAELAHDLKNRRVNNTICLVDRSPLSMWSYQVKGSGVSGDLGMSVIRDGLKALSPDLLIVYTAPVSVLRTRMKARNKQKSDYFESKPDDYFERVIVGYEEASELFGAVAINAEGTREEMHQKTMEVISHKIIDSQT